MQIYRATDVQSNPPTLKFPISKTTYTFSELIRNCSLHKKAFEALKLLSSRGQATEYKSDGYTNFALESGGCLLFDSKLKIVGYDHGSHSLDLSQTKTKRQNKAA
jgi:hypothetical protein